MNKRGRGFDCERQNNKSLMQSCLDILYVFYFIFFSSKNTIFYFQAGELQIYSEICHQVGNMIQCVRQERVRHKVKNTVSVNKTMTSTLSN